MLGAPVLISLCPLSVQALMIGTSGINVANCYKQYGGSVDILKVRVQCCCLCLCLLLASCRCNQHQFHFFFQILVVGGFWGKPRCVGVLLVRETLSLRYAVQLNLELSLRGRKRDAFCPIFCITGKVRRNVTVFCSPPPRHENTEMLPYAVASPPPPDDGDFTVHSMSVRIYLVHVVSFLAV